MQPDFFGTKKTLGTRDSGLATKNQLKNKKEKSHKSIITLICFEP